LDIDSLRGDIVSAHDQAVPIPGSFYGRDDEGGRPGLYESSCAREGTGMREADYRF
jgi:hypothetical protein